MMNNDHTKALVPTSRRTSTLEEVGDHHAAQDHLHTGRDDALPSCHRLVHEGNANDPPQDELDGRARASSSVANSKRNNSNSSRGQRNDVVSCCSSSAAPVVALQLKQQIHDGDEENVDARRNSTGFTGAGGVGVGCRSSVPPAGARPAENNQDIAFYPTAAATTNKTSATTTPSSILTKLRLLNAFLVRRFLVVIECKNVSWVWKLVMLKCG